MNQLYELQTRQFRHDIACHADIASMAPQARMKHLILHLTKYTGYLAEPQDNNDRERLIRVLVDGFIITLSAANVLKIDLSNRMIPRMAAVEPAGKAQAAILGIDLSNCYGRALTGFAKNTGQMAKALEALDHLEAYYHYDILTNALVDLCALIMALASAISINLVELVKSRWHILENQPLSAIGG